LSANFQLVSTCYSPGTNMKVTYPLCHRTNASSPRLGRTRWFNFYLHCSFFSLFISFPWHFPDKNQSNLPIYTHPSLSPFGCFLQPLSCFSSLTIISAQPILQAIGFHKCEIFFYKILVWVKSKPAHQTVIYTEWHIPDVVLIKLILLMMGTWLPETCRE
jgi:hypothetical protein